MSRRTLQGAQATISLGHLLSATNAEGGFTFLGLPGGTYTVTASYQGFSPKSQLATLGAELGRLDCSLAVASATASVDVIAGREGGEVER